MAEAAARRCRPCRARGSRHSRQRVIQRRPRRQPCPQPQARAVGRRAQPPREFALAPVPHHLRQRDLDRADALASAAEGRGVRQMAGLAQPDQRRGQHRPHRPGIDPAIGVPADRGIDRAMVEAGRAAQAAQHVLELAAEQLGAAVVEQHDMVLLRPVEIARPARPGRDRRVGRKFLSRRRARQQAQQRRRVLQGRHDLLDAGHDDMDARQGLRQIAVALVGDDDAGAGLGDQKIGAGDPDIGGEEFAAAARCAPRRTIRAARRAGGRDRGRDARRGTCRRPAPSSDGSPAR